MTNNYAVTIALTTGRSMAVVYGASDKYHALRTVRDHGYTPVKHIAVREVSDDVAALIPYEMWATDTLTYAAHRRNGGR